MWGSPPDSARRQRKANNVSYPPLAMTVKQACARACIGKTSFYRELSLGRIRAVRRGRRTLILAVDLDEWLNNLPPVRPKARNGGGKSKAAENS
jgi:excisionase family DNA binding protein